MAAWQKYRMYPYIDTCLAVVLGNGQKLNDIAQLLGIADICRFDPGNALYGHLIQPNTAVEGNGSQDSGLSGSIQSLHISSRIGLGIALGLGILQHNIIVGSLIRHLGQHIIGGTIDNAHNLGNLVARETFLQRGDNWNTAAYAGLKAEIHTLGLCHLKELMAHLSHHILVGSNHMLAILHGIQHELKGRMQAAHKLYHNIYLRIIDDIQGVVCQLHSIQILTLLVHITHQDLLDADGSSYLLGNILAILLKYSHNTGSYSTGTQ